jgi:hypothetical protein
MEMLARVEKTAEEAYRRIDLLNSSRRNEEPDTLMCRMDALAAAITIHARVLAEHGATLQAIQGPHYPLDGWMAKQLEDIGKKEGYYRQMWPGQIPNEEQLERMRKNGGIHPSLLPRTGKR